MTKQSKRNRRRIHQGGFGGGFTVVRRVPIRVQRNLPHAPTLSADAYERLRFLEYAQRTSVREASIAFRVPVSTISRWRTRYRPDDLTSLECHSRRPNRTRRSTWTAAHEAAVRDLRQRYPRMGKMPIREPHAVRIRKARPVRPYATRVPKDKRQPTEPGALVQLDTMHLRPLPGVARRQFTAIDVVSRCAVVGVRATASAGTATAVLDELVARMPVAVQAIQVDGGSEFMAGFERACQDRGIALYVLPPRSPKLNGRVERLNGTSRRAFWECDEGDLDLPTVQAALHDWEVTDNTIRPHQALGYATPHDFLRSKFQEILRCIELGQKGRHQ